MKNNYKIIAKFEYNNNKYFIANVNDAKNVLVKYNENKKIETEFTEEEFKIINLIYNSLCINKEKSVHIKDEIVNNNVYKIFYDPDSKNYFWNSNNENVNKILNFKYNNMLGTYFLSDKDSEIDEKLEELKKEFMKKLEELDSNISDDSKETDEKSVTDPNIDEEDKSKQDEQTSEEITEQRKEEINEEKTSDDVFIEENEEECDEEEKIEKTILPLWKMIYRDNSEQTDNLGLTNAEREEIRKIVKHIKEQKAKVKVESEKTNVRVKIPDNILKTSLHKTDPELKTELDSAYEVEQNENTENNQESERKENTEYYTKLVRFKKQLVPVLVSAGMVFSAFSPVFGANGRKVKEVEQQTVETIEETEKKEYSYDRLAQALDENPNLTQEEKDFIGKFKIVFDEDNEYMNIGMIEDRYKTLKISYENAYSSEKHDKYLTLAGTYNEIKNQITMNGVSNFAEADKKDLAHECSHVLQMSSQRYIMELINEMFTREKLRELKENGLLEQELFEDNTNTNSNFGNGYSNHMYIGYIFASLMDEETLKKYQYTCNDRALVDKLCSIDKNVPHDIAINNSYQLLSCIDSLRIWNNEKQTFEINQEAEERCKEKLNYYFKLKNGKNIEEDLNCVIHKPYYNDNVYSAIERTLLDETANQKNEGKDIDVLQRTVLPRTYFSSKHKKQEILLGTTRIEITDELNERYRQNYYQLERGMEYER